MKRQRHDLKQPVFQAIKDGSSPDKVRAKIEAAKWNSEYLSCTKKEKFNPEEAAANYGRYRTAPSAYICRRCSFIHFGHEINWDKQAEQLMQTPHYRQIQHEKSVKKQKSKLKPPPKMK